MGSERRQIKKIGLVYSGGLARGAAELAYAKQIIEKIGMDKVAVISASSIGALNAYATSCNHIDQMLYAYKNIDADDKLAFMKQIRRGLFNSIFKQVEGKQMLMPVYVSGTKIFQLVPHYFCLNKMPRSDIKKAINVSMAFPLINGPHRFNGGIYIDGGATDNVPTYPMNYFDVDMIIILHCYPKYYPPAELYEAKKNTVIVDADVTLSLDKKVTSFSLSRENFIYMIEKATVAGKEFADAIFLDGDFDYERVQKRCYEYTNAKMHARHIKNGDGLMSLVDILNALYRVKEDSWDRS